MSTLVHLAQAATDQAQLTAEEPKPLQVPPARVSRMAWRRSAPASASA